MTVVTSSCIRVLHPVGWSVKNEEYGDLNKVAPYAVVPTVAQVLKNITSFLGSAVLFGMPLSEFF